MSFYASTSVADAKVDQCLASAAAYHHQDLRLVRAIAWQESKFNPNAISGKNSNNSQDIGLMQVNDSWIPRLAKFGITRERLLDPCTNAFVGVWILSMGIKEHGYTWRAVGSYNAKSESKRLIYAKKINSAMLAGY